LSGGGGVDVGIAIWDGETTGGETAGGTDDDGVLILSWPYTKILLRANRAKKEVIRGFNNNPSRTTMVKNRSDK